MYATCKAQHTKNIKAMLMGFTLPAQAQRYMLLLLICNKDNLHMPQKEARLTRRQSIFARRMAQGQAVSDASTASGYVDHTGGVRAIQTPHVQAEIARIQTERLFNEVLPLAIQVHIDVLTNPATPAGARVAAIKLAYDRTLGGDATGNDKQPHEMTADELARAIDDARLRAAALESVKADRAKPVIEGDLFG
jgi:hypothetical protein